MQNGGCLRKDLAPCADALFRATQPPKLKKSGIRNGPTWALTAMLPLRFAVSVKLGFNHFCWHLCFGSASARGKPFELASTSKNGGSLCRQAFTLNDFKGIQLSTPINPTLSLHCPFSLVWQQSVAVGAL